MSDQTAPAMPPAAPARPLRLAVVLLLLFTVQCVLLLGPEAQVVSNMQGDAMHLLDGARRVALGQQAHLDFVTPLGALNFHLVGGWDAPPGRALALANIAVMAVLLPALLWTGASRFAFPAGLFLGICALVLAGGMSFSPGATGATPAMSYNRFGWAALLATAPLMLLPPRAEARGGGGDWADGLTLGLIGGLLVFVKITYAVAMAPLWLVWALTARRPRAVLVSLAAGLAAMAACAAFTGGLEGVAAYIADLRMVAASDTRPEPGIGLIALPAHPANAVLTLGALAGVMALLRAGLRREAALVAIAAAAIYVIAWQNYSNHATGAVLLPLVLLALVRRIPPVARTLGAPARTVVQIAAVAILAVAAPPLLSMERSLAAAWVQSEAEAQRLPRVAPDILWPLPERGLRVEAPAGEEDEGAAELAGVSFQGCTNADGWSLLYAEGAEEMRANPALRGRSVMVADIVDALWLPAGSPPLEGAQIWIYEPPERVLARAELLAVPRCPASGQVRNLMLEAAGALPFRRIAESRSWVFFENPTAQDGG